MLSDIEILEEHVMLGTESEAPPDAGHVLRDVVAVDRGRARGRREHPCEDGHRGGLTRSIMAKEGGYLARIGRESHTVDCVNCLAPECLSR